MFSTTLQFIRLTSLSIKRYNTSNGASMLTYSYLQYKQERKKTYLHRQQQVHFVLNTRVPIQVRLASGPVTHLSKNIGTLNVHELF